MNEFYFTTVKPLVFWRKLKTPKRHFEIVWPLAVPKFLAQDFFFSGQNYLCKNPPFYEINLILPKRLCAWRNFVNIFCSPLFTVIFWPKHSNFGYIFHFEHVISDILGITGYSFWDWLRIFLHKVAWIVFTVHKLNKLGKFW